MDVYEDSVLDAEWSKYLESISSEKKTESKNKKKKKRELSNFTDLKKHVRDLSRARLELELEGDLNDSLDDGDNEEDLEESEQDRKSAFLHHSVLESYWNEADSNSSNNVSCQDSSSDSNSHKSNDSEDTEDEALGETLKSAKIAMVGEQGSISMPTKKKKSSPRPRKASNPKPEPIAMTEPQKQAEHSSDEEEHDGYDQELEALKEQLKDVRKKSKRHLRSKSKEEILLSVLDIDQSRLNQNDLRKYTKKAVTAYNRMHKSGQKHILRQKSVRNLLQSNMIVNTKKRAHRRSVSSRMSTHSRSLYNEEKGSIYGLKRRKKKLADPYLEEWNDSLDPDDYIWYDNVPEGQCSDDAELSLRNRRIQYLVVMALANEYTTITKLSYKQNELLLLHQKELRF